MTSRLVQLSVRSKRGKTMKHSLSRRRLIVALFAVLLAIAALTAQMAVLADLPTLSAFLPGRGVLARLSSAVPTAGLETTWQHLRAHVPAALAAPSPESELQAAWERARQAGAYSFTADAEQTLIPRPIPGMIGQTDQRVDLRLEGEVTLPDHAHLQLRFEGAGLNQQPLELRSCPKTTS